MNLKPTLVMAAMAAAATFVQAEDIHWDAHGVIEVGLGQVATGPFNDSFVFRLEQASALQASAVANNLNDMFNITDGFVSLLRRDPASGAEELISRFSFSGTTGNISAHFGKQGVGDYVYRITGFAMGNMGGVYSLASAVTAVPEPSTLAMLMAGVAALGLAQRRYKGRR